MWGSAVLLTLLLAMVPRAWVWGVALLGAVRIVDILVTVYGVVLKDSGELASAARTFRLALVNLWEIVVGFAALHLSVGATQPALESPADAIYFSLLTTVTVAFGDYRPVHAGRVVAMAQLVTTVAFLFGLLPGLLARIAALRAGR